MWRPSIGPVPFLILLVGCSPAPKPAPKPLPPVAPTATGPPVVKVDPNAAPVPIWRYPPKQEGPPPPPEELRSLVRVLRYAGSVKGVSQPERQWLMDNADWKDSDFDELRFILGQSFTGQEGWSLSGGSGETQTGFATGEAAWRAIISMERNNLLSDLVETGDIDRVTDFLRNHRKTPPTIYLGPERQYRDR